MSLAKEIWIGHANFERSGLRETEDGADVGWSVRMEVHRQKNTDFRRPCQVQGKGLILFSQFR